MSPLIASILAVFTGAIVWILVTYVGAVVVLLAMHGIPLGSRAWEPSATEYAVLLLVGAIGAASGGRTAGGFARAHREAARYVLPAVMIATLLWGFSDEASTWPGWWAPALAAVSAAGSGLGTRSVAARPRSG